MKSIYLSVLILLSNLLPLSSTSLPVPVIFSNRKPSVAVTVAVAVEGNDVVGDDSNGNDEDDDADAPHVDLVSSDDAGRGGGGVAGIVH